MVCEPLGIDVDRMPAVRLDERDPGRRERFADRTARDPATQAHAAAVVFAIDQAFETA